MKSKKIYTAVVLGCGRIGASFEFDPFRPKPASHAASFVHTKRTKLVAVVDADEALAKKAGAYFGVPFFTDANTCLKTLTPDIVAIATPPQTHEPLIALAIAHGVQGVICEKPLAYTEKSARNIVAMLHKAPIVFVVNHQRRFFPLFKKLKSSIAKGEFGRVQQVTCYYNNGLYNNGTHTLDSLRFLLQSEVAWVVGVENKTNTLAPVGDSNIDGMVGFANGTVAAIQSMDVAAVGIHDFHLLSDTASVSITNYGYRFETRLIKKSSLFKGSNEISLHGTTRDDVRSMLSASTEHMVQCLDGEEEVGSTALDGLKTMQTLDALVKSAKTKKIIHL